MYSSIRLVARSFITIYLVTSPLLVKPRSQRDMSPCTLRSELFCQYESVKSPKNSQKSGFFNAFHWSTHGRDDIVCLISMELWFSCLEHKHSRLSRSDQRIFSPLFLSMSVVSAMAHRNVPLGFYETHKIRRSTNGVRCRQRTRTWSSCADCPFTVLCGQVIDETRQHVTSCRNSRVVTTTCHCVLPALCRSHSASASQQPPRFKDWMEPWPARQGVQGTISLTRFGRSSIAFSRWINQRQTLSGCPQRKQSPKRKSHSALRVFFRQKQRSESRTDSPIAGSTLPNHVRKSPCLQRTRLLNAVWKMNTHYLGRDCTALETQMVSMSLL